MIKKNLMLIFGTILALLLVFSVVYAQGDCHGVWVCNTSMTDGYYECGVEDGVCPEDFDGCDVCFVPDPDCEPAAPIFLTVNDVPANFQGTYPVETNIIGWKDTNAIPDGDLYLFLDGTLVDENSDEVTYVLTHEVGVYEYRLLFNNSVHFEDREITRTVTIRSPSVPTPSPGAPRRPSYVCEEDLAIFIIIRLDANQIYRFFESFDRRFCTDLHFYELMLNKNVEEAEVRIESIEMEGIPPEGFVYKYHNVSAKQFTDEHIEFIDFLYRVPKSWANEHGVYERTVHLYRRDRVFWTELESYVFQEDDEYYYLRAEGDILAPHAIVGQGVDIWDVLEVIGFYYEEQIEFMDVLTYIDRYYTAQARLI